ncbi:MAG TPA: chorismate mutase [Jatrophihabitans sp.]
MSSAVRALRGATTVDSDSKEQIEKRVQALIREMLARNDAGKDEIISIIFTATEDLTSMFPASAARSAGLGDVPLLCARELAIEGGTPRCIRLLMHINTEKDRADLRHVYLEGAQGLRDDLPG